MRCCYTDSPLSGISFLFPIVWLIVTTAAAATICLISAFVLCFRSNFSAQIRTICLFMFLFLNVILVYCNERNGLVLNLYMDWAIKTATAALEIY